MAIAQAGVEQVIKSADVVSKQALIAVAALEDAAIDLAHGGVDAVDESFELLLEQTEALRVQFIESVRVLATEAAKHVDAVMPGGG